MASPLPLSNKERTMVEGVWPIHLLEDPRLQPRILSSVEEFQRELLVGDHLEDIVVLPNGVNLLGLTEDEAWPGWFPSALDGASTVLEFLRRLDSDVLVDHKAALEYVDDWGVQREALPRPYPFCLWDEEEADGATETHVNDTQLSAESGIGAASAMPEAWRNLRQRRAAVEALVRRGEVDPTRLYACEMRRLRERPPNKGATAASGLGKRLGTKSLSLRHVRDSLGALARWTLYWNCHDDGVFVGGRGSGKGLHVDQVLWSNVGKHWRGHKLMAVWHAGEMSARLADELLDAHFWSPLTASQLAALEVAAKVVLLRPGDVFLFSGGVAHATINVSDELTVTAYESLVTLHPRHVAHFIRTGCGGAQAVRKGVMESDDLRDFREDIVRRLHALLEMMARDVSVSSQLIARRREDGGTSGCFGGGEGEATGTQGLLGELCAKLAAAARAFASDQAYAALITTENLISLAESLAPAHAAVASVEKTSYKARPPFVSTGGAALVAKRRRLDTDMGVADSVAVRNFVDAELVPKIAVAAVVAAESTTQPLSPAGSDSSISSSSFSSSASASPSSAE
eukprot:TRINITY_DN43375_c0_g1_i1.p1 TRINITY_DN43375_c0_g1~~TRINITY_DN43375_c0_g1_i1.p1  ORF type:complete len:572 (+),score=97.97 TRINITY_DN43375_c0_g1_i1:27-1742(+)